MKLSLGLYPGYSIADAREWANGLAHELYMEAVREGRSSRAKRVNKARTVSDKQDIYRRDIAPSLGA